MSLKLENVSYTYAVGTPFAQQALHNISYTFADGSFTGIIGPTGSGKSTLLQLLDGLLLPSSGRVLINNQDTRHLHRRELIKIRRQVGLVFQFPERQIFETTVADDIAFGLQQQKLLPAELKQRLHWVLEQVGLSPELLKRAPDELSSGQKRLVAIAGVLVMQPQVLALDEPTAGLDAEARKGLLELLTRLNQSGTTIIMVSHSLSDLAQVCRQLMLLTKGQIAVQGDLTQILTSRQELLRHGFELPLWQEIIWQLQQKGWHFTNPVHDIESASQAIVQALKYNGK